MRISVAIPCIPRDVQPLLNCLKEYKSQTVLPKEVVISLSESGSATKVDKTAIRDSMAGMPVKVTLLETESMEPSGINRQLASDCCTGDIIAYQDADDTPHHRRLEIVSWFFDNYDIVHLNHSYVKGIDIPFSDIDVCKVLHNDSDTMYHAYFGPGYPGDYKRCLLSTGAYGGNAGLGDTPIHAGVPVIRKEVLSKVRWRHTKDLVLSSNCRMEDYEFNMEVLYTFNKTMLIDAKIYRYIS